MEKKPEPIVEVRNLTKYFGKKKVLDNVSFKVFQNELLLIIGFSGTGKSTLLKLICGLEEPDSGEVILKTKHIGMVFQGSALFDSMNVFDNVAFPLINNPTKLTAGEIKEKVLEKLRLVGLAGMENLRPDELSGGMKKRVGFARTIINDPDIILYDEPTSGLDPVVSNVIVDYILKLQHELNASSVLVTHNLNVIKKISSRVILLYDSKIAWEGTSQELFTAEHPYTKQFREGAVHGPMVVIKE
ncbi:MAG: ATP-binding cassette domain-containing protein [Candidatus Melainabacteria bacterium]|nr:ATP-binding cassette domain-containing protein [Candidatus Melainabacteria bacterium]